MNYAEDPTDRELDKKPTGALAEIEQLTRVIDSIVDRVEILSKRIDPALQRDVTNPEEAPTLAAVKPAHSHLVLQLIGARDRLEVLEGRLASLAARVEL